MTFALRGHGSKVGIEREAVGILYIEQVPNADREGVKNPEIFANVMYGWIPRRGKSALGKQWVERGGSHAEINASAAVAPAT